MMRELTQIDHVVCASEIEASITEIRLIDRPCPPLQPPFPPDRQRPLGAAHRRAVPPPLGGAQPAEPGAGPSRPVPPQVDRRAGDDRDLGCGHPIRRCIGTRGGPRCRFAQLGVAVCPCDGSVDPARVRRRSSTLVLPGDDRAPRAAARTRSRADAGLAASQRFEQAADVRDRYRALAAALDTRLAWRAFADGRCGLGRGPVRRRRRHRPGAAGGRLAPYRPAAAPWRRRPDGEAPSRLPRAALAAEELRLLWRWLDRPGVTVVHSDAPLVLPPALPTDFRLAPGPTPPAPAT